MFKLYIYLLFYNRIVFNFQFVTSPKCQYILNEIIYLGWRKWQDEGFMTKAILFLVQFLLVSLASIVYIPLRLIRRCCCRGQFEDKCFWKFRKLYEHPYSKFINQTMSYVLFLCLVFASSYRNEFKIAREGPEMVTIGKKKLYNQTTKVFYMRK